MGTKTLLVPGGFENQSVSGVTTICPTQCNTSPSHRVDQVVDCGLWNVCCGTIHSVDISKLLTHTTPYTLSAFCPVQWKPGFIREENTSPKCQTPSNVSICPLKLVMTKNKQSGWDPEEDDEHADEIPLRFPETVSDSLCRNYLIMQIDCCSSCPGGWSQTILEVKMLDVEVLGWCGYTWSAVVRPVGCTAKFSETPLETAYGRETTIQFTGNSSGGHSCSQHANCTLPQNLRHLWYCAVW